MRVLRVYHGGRDAAHREWNRALVRAGVELTLVVPRSWPEADDVTGEQFDIVELPVVRPGDVNRHRYADARAVAAVIEKYAPDVVDLHEEPFSSVVHQLLRLVPREQAVVAYTAQNLDKRFPPPFAQYERAALRRLDGLYPCSAQAASVAVGKGYGGVVQVLGLAPAPAFVPGDQQPPRDELHMLVVGRLVPWKGIRDAVQVLAGAGPASTLTLIGHGPELEPARDLARRLGVADALRIEPWLDAAALAERYRSAQIVLVPSFATRTWAEQFGRVVVEAQASGAVVVAYSSGALPEVVADAGVLVAEHDVQALTAAVLGLRAHPQRWAALRDAGLRATQTWDAVAAAHVELYHQARGRARSRAAVRRPRPAGADRASAVAGYGPPARLEGADRPFALPVLRENSVFSRSLATAVDAVARSRPRHPDRLRVVFLDHVARPSGGEIALVRLLAALPDVEARVILGEDGPLVAELEAVGAVVEVVPLDPGARDTGRGAALGAGGLRSAAATAAYTARLARRLRQLRPDLVHTNSLKSGWYGCAAARIAGVPAVWHLRDRLAPDYLPPRAIAVTRGLLAHLPNAVVCPSEEVARHVGGPVAVIADPYAASRPPRGPVGPPTVVGTVGRISPWKGQEVVLRAVARVPQLELRIIGTPMFGEDAYLEQLHTLAADLGVARRVRFVGFAADVEAELAELDVLVHASTVAEPFGQVVVEGLAAGVPVIATDAGGPREILTDGVTGLLVPPGDVAALVAAFGRLTDDAQLRARLAENGLQRSAAYAPDLIGVRMQMLYRSVLGR